MTAAALRNLALAATFCAVGVPLAGAPAAWAGAGDDAHVVVEDYPIGAGQAIGPTVDCGPGERAIGGGAGFEGSSISTMSASGPIDAENSFALTNDGDIPVSWYSEIYNGTGAQHAYRFYAICSASSDATVQREELHLLEAAAPGNPTYGEDFVACPAGQRAIGGGAGYSEFTESGGTRLEASGPLDEGGTTTGTEDGDAARYWFAEVRNFDTDMLDGQYYGIYAICSATSQATVQTEVFGSNDNVDTGLACPAGSRAIGGGAVSPTTNVTTLSYSGPTDALGLPGMLENGGIPLGWETRATHDGIDNVAIKHSVVCDPPTPSPPAATPAGATGQRAAALKKCKKKHGKKRKRCLRRARRLPA
jgi:hypothetical protein